VAQTIASKLRLTRGAVDVHLQQITNAPEFFVKVDRQQAQELGLNEQQIATDMNVSLSGSFQVTPNFWADPKTGIPYQVWVQTPEYRNDTLTAITNTPLLISAGTSPGPSVAALIQRRDVDARQRTDGLDPRRHSADL
jgi:multidrug efflux pump subunit AcrB